MLDARVRLWIDPLLTRLAGWLVRRRVSAETITWAGFGAGMAAAALVALSAFGPALGLFLVSRGLDGLDGAVARTAGRTSDRGGFLDITLDFLVYSGMGLGFAFADPGTNALPVAVLLFSFVGTGSSFLAYAAIAARRQTPADPPPAKAIVYLGGLTEGTETIAFFALACLWPAGFPLLAMVFAGLCLLTTLGRIAAGLRAFRDPP